VRTWSPPIPIANSSSFSPLDKVGLICYNILKPGAGIKADAKVGEGG